MGNRAIWTLGAAVVLSASAPAMAQGGLMNTILTTAAEKALGRLSVPGGFLADKAVSIGVPGLGGGTTGSILKVADKLGVTKGLTKSVNDAAGSAAGVAKPIFKDAIRNFKLSDVPTVLASTDGGTQYLKTSAGEQLKGKLRPIVQSALLKNGAFRQLGQLGAAGAAAGLSQDRLTDSVTDQALNGIFRYMGEEETKLRADPVGAGASLLRGLMK